MSRVYSLVSAGRRGHRLDLLPVHRHVDQAAAAVDLLADVGTGVAVQGLAHPVHDPPGRRHRGALAPVGVQLAMAGRAADHPVVREAEKARRLTLGDEAAVRVPDHVRARAVDDTAGLLPVPALRLGEAAGVPVAEPELLRPGETLVVLAGRGVVPGVRQVTVALDVAA